jgi:hypothetical protein
VPPETARATSPSQPHLSTRQRPRHERVATVIDLEAARQARASTRAVARTRGVSESTLRGWRQRAHDDDLSDPVRRFFETPEGLRLLHRIVTAALVVIVLMGGNGVALVRAFLVWCGLDGLVACSDRHLHGRVSALHDAVGAWGDAERARLAVTMPTRALSICADETFHDGMLLVAQEPRSGFLLVEKRSERRDAQTWDRAVREGIAGLPVTIEQVTSDEADGLIAMARKHLGAQHTSDVFHGQHELCGGLLGALRSPLRVAREALDAARSALDKVVAAHAAWQGAPRTPGRPPQWDEKIAQGTEVVAQAEGALHRLLTQKAGLCEAIRDLGEAVWPIDLRSGEWLSSEGVRARLEGIFDEIWQRAAELGLPERTIASITKVRRLVDVWVSTVAWWNGQVQRRLYEAPVAPEVQALMHAVLIPAALLEEARRRAPTGMVRRALAAVITEVTTPLREAEGVWSQLPEETRRAASALAMECAGLFQPSSSCVEGRNGYLSLRHHHLHALPAPWLKTLTVLHNFVIRRDDGTTAAERFFGREPNDLFEHLVAVTPLPARPRTRRRRAVPDLFAAAA